MDGGAYNRLLVTGATGFVGPHLIAALRQNFGSALEIVSASPQGEALDGASSAKLDLTDPGSARALVEAVRPDACLHLAGVSHISHALKNPLDTWTVNLMGALALAEALQACVPDAPLVHVSSGEVYGLTANAGRRLTEDSPLAPANLYSVTKASADLALGEMALRGLRVVRLRPFNHTGPGQSADFVVPHIAKQVAAAERAGGGELAIGALDHARDFLDVSDVCAAYIATLRRFDRLPNGIALNIASETERSIGSILTEITGLSHTPIVVRHEPQRLRLNDVARVRADAQRARSLLGWEPLVPWSQTLESVLAYWRGRPDLA